MIFLDDYTTNKKYTMRPNNKMAKKVTKISHIFYINIIKKYKKS